MRALVCAKSYGSISIPAISSGVFGFPIDVCADTLIQAVIEFSEIHEDSELTDINFIILRKNASAFQRAMVINIQSSGAASSSFLSSASHSVNIGATRTHQPAYTTNTHAPHTHQVFPQYLRSLTSSSRKENKEMFEKKWMDSSDCDVSDLNEVVITIFGRTNDALRHAEKLILEIVKDQFVQEVIIDEDICRLTRDQVTYLEKEASSKNVEIEIDRDPALHQIKLHACRADVLYLKDKVREAVYKVRRAQSKLEQEKAILSAANVRWLSDGDDVYDEVLNYEIEQAYQQKQSGYKCNKVGEEFIIDFKTMEETDLVTGDVVKVIRVDLAAG